MRVVVACVVASVVWIVCEIAGGLAFLAMGVRLWRYEIAPMAWDITSPIVWLFAVTLIVPLSIAFERRYTLGQPRRVRLVRLALFVAIVGPLLEVLINELVFKALLRVPLYEYLALPTFNGSGSWLSPLYYLTLLVHVPITDRILYPSSR
ncbi:MAG: hypothetical protein ABIU95_14740 [Burkholderiales bacterium]